MAKASVNLSIKATLPASEPYGQGVEVTPAPDVVRTLLDGNTDETQIDVIYAEKIEIAASATETVDLSSIADAYGNSITLVDVDLLVFYTPGTPGVGGAANPDIVEIGPNATDGFLGPWKGATDRSKLTPKGLVMFMDPASNYSVDGTHKEVDLENTDSGDTAYVYMLLLGRSS